MPKFPNLIILLLDECGLTGQVHTTMWELFIRIAPFFLHKFGLLPVWRNLLYSTCILSYFIVCFYISLKQLDLTINP